MTSAAQHPSVASGLTEINPRQSFISAPVMVWRNIWTYRFLVWSFVQRDLRVRYRGSVLGYFWSLLEPLLLTLTYYILFTVVAGRPQERYPLWVILGVLTWQFFTKSMNGGVTSLTKGAGMIKQVYFPREIFAVTVVGSQLVITCLSLLVAVPMLVYFQAPPTLNLLLVPAGLVLTGLLGLGIGLGAAVINAVHRDIEHLFRFVARAGFYLSPVMWTVAQVPPGRAGAVKYLLYNPMFVPIEMVRSGIQGEPLASVLSTGTIAYSVLFCVGSFVVGSMLFKRFEGEVVKNI